MNIRKIRNDLGVHFIRIICGLLCLLFFLIFFTLIVKSSTILGDHSLIDLLFSPTWNPTKGEFGLGSVIVGTIYVTVIALIIAIPISLLSAVYLSEYAPRKIRKILRPFIDVLAGVPSVVYGLCAFLLLVPLVKDYIAPFFGIQSTGLCIFTASITLAIMVFPIIISLCVESFDAVPLALKEASLSVGATKWETIKKVVFKASAPGIFSAILLGFGRAFGETIAINMVIGGVPRIPETIFHPGQTLASLIASSYGELMSIPLYESALIFVALILFVVVLLFNLFSVLVLRRTKRKWKL